MNYKFTALKDLDLIIGTSNLMNIEHDEKDFNCLVMGKLKTLFGNPLSVSEDMENGYDYVIEAFDTKNDQKYILTVYMGPSGHAKKV